MGIKTLGDLGGLVRSAWETIASAATISPKTDKVKITGTTTIQTINRPNSYFTGPMYLYSADAAPVLGTSGNIAKAVAGVANRVLVLMYDAGTAKWYPSQ
jgi:hypothetical protein